MFVQGNLWNYSDLLQMTFHYKAIDLMLKNQRKTNIVTMNYFEMCQVGQCTRWILVKTLKLYWMPRVLMRAHCGFSCKTFRNIMVELNLKIGTLQKDKSCIDKINTTFISAYSVFYKWIIPIEFVCELVRWFWYYS